MTQFPSLSNRRDIVFIDLNTENNEQIFYFAIKLEYCRIKSIVV